MAENSAPKNAPAVDAQTQALVDKLSEMPVVQNFSKMIDAVTRDDADDPTDALLTAAIDEALASGKGWEEGEREDYLSMINDDDYLPPIFCSTQDEMDNTGLSDAFVSLLGDNDGTTPPEVLMAEARKRGNGLFGHGESNVAATGKNMRFYRDAINAYGESVAWGERVPVVEDGEEHETEGDDRKYTRAELDAYVGATCSNVALCHLRLKNWGHARDLSRKSLRHDPRNVKSAFRLATALSSLKDYGGAGEAIDAGLAVPGEDKNRDLMRLRRSIWDKIKKARAAKARRERARAERSALIKKVWGHCKKSKIKLGRTPLVATVDIDDDEGDGDGDEHDENRWNSHFPHTGRVPQIASGSANWPVMFLYPSHRQSDFVSNFYESDMFALRMAEIFPEPEDATADHDAPWDHGGDFVCSNLAVYMEVHARALPATDDGSPVHPEDVRRLSTMKETMRFYETARALRSDEGERVAEATRLTEKLALHRQRRAWIKKYGNLVARGGDYPPAVLRVHPAATLRDVLVDERAVVPNFIPTFLLFPENHPAHIAFLKERKVLGLLQPKQQE